MTAVCLVERREVATGRQMAMVGQGTGAAAPRMFSAEVWTGKIEHEEISSVVAGR